MGQKSKVFLFDGEDPEMQGAMEKARTTFKYFWRELAWERRRIIPGLDLACVKAPFSDGEPIPEPTEHPQVEQMWITDVDFDGREVSGTLINSPNWIKSVKEGDEVRLPLAEISDWMYALEGQVYGAYTVNLMRSRMQPRERAEHDAAWGFDFGDPAQIRVVPADKKPGLLKSLFGKKPAATIGEHPMSENMGPALVEQLRESPEMLHDKDEKGWTLLHHQALAGSAASVKVLLEMGAKPNAKANDGTTPLTLARALGWDVVIGMLEKSGAR